MCPSTLSPAILADMNSTCEAGPALLNSERIERRFGSFGIAVLPSEAGLRRSSIYSRHGHKRICRTYAVVRFSGQPNDRYREEHAKVLAGNSIGAVFRAHGWDVYKQTTYIGRLAVPGDGNPIASLMHLDDGGELATHVYQLLLARAEQALEYATIIETHHPEYLSEADLSELYDYDPNAPLDARAVTELTTLVLQSDR